MTADDHAAFVALGKGIASRDGYKPQQGSDLYIVSGDQDDWAYGTHGIFAMTIELPKGAAKRYYPTQSEINKFNSQNLNAVLWYLKQADCPYAAAGLGSKYCGNSSNQQYYSESVFNQAAVQPQQTNCWCAVASTRATLESIDASISVAQTDVNDYMTAHDKNNWTDPAFSDYVRCVKGTPSPSYAHDSRGMAWALWNWATPDQSMGFNDYEGGNQSTMDWRIVHSIRANGYPVGAIVVHGAHAILVVGYQTALDPLNEDGQANTILGMRVWDPWYNAGFGNWSGWPAGGFAPNSYVTLSDWNKQVLHGRPQRGSVFPGQVRRRDAELGRASAVRYAGHRATATSQYALANPAPSPTPSPSADRLADRRPVHRLHLRTSPAESRPSVARRSSAHVRTAGAQPRDRPGGGRWPDHVRLAGRSATLAICPRTTRSARPFTSIRWSPGFRRTTWPSCASTASSRPWPWSTRSTAVTSFGELRATTGRRAPADDRAAVERPCRERPARHAVTVLDMDRRSGRAAALRAVPDRHGRFRPDRVRDARRCGRAARHGQRSDLDRQLGRIPRRGPYAPLACVSCTWPRRA